MIRMVGRSRRERVNLKGSAQPAYLTGFINSLLTVIVSVASVKIKLVDTLFDRSAE
jgi:hypothetical protein